MSALKSLNLIYCLPRIKINRLKVDLTLPFNLLDTKTTRMINKNII
jgi:hypothetical protein